MSSWEHEVSGDEAGLRLDLLLVRAVPGLGRARAKKLAEEARINGRRASKGARVSVGDRVSLAEAPQPTLFEAAPDPDAPLVIVHADADLVVIDKPAGMPSHPLAPNERGTAAGALVARFPSLREVGHSPREPGIVHRLDTDTSGLLVAACHRAAFDALVRSLADGRWDKRYLALCPGRVREGLVVDAPIAARPGDPRRVLACPSDSDAVRLGARPAVTEVLRVTKVGAFSLVLVRARSARRHQVRAHLAFAGFPLVGDSLYGGPAFPGLARHFLHASHLTLPHPRTDLPIALESKLPPELQAVVDAGKGGAA